MSKKKKIRKPDVYIDVPDDITLDQLFEALIVLSKDGKPPRFEFTEEEQGMRGGWDIYTEAIDDCMDIVIRRRNRTAYSDAVLDEIINDLKRLKENKE